LLDGRIVAVFNIGSGSCDASSEGLAREIFTDANLFDVEILSVDPSAISAALTAAADRADVLVILGGDGTIGVAANLRNQRLSRCDVETQGRCLEAQ
jgi:diacylglycerol kinase family enzyme